MELTAKSTPQDAGAGSASGAQNRSLFQRLSESSHPIAVLFFLGLRIGSLLAYLFGLLFTSNFILDFIIIVLLLSFDFWNVKNISGRLLVGLRWWNETNAQGESVWVFETADPDRYINPIDSKVFWLLVYGAPVAWVVLGVVAILKFEFLSLILVSIALILSGTNAMAYTKCDKFSKAKAGGNIFQTITEGFMNRLNPLNSLFG